MNTGFCSCSSRELGDAGSTSYKLKIVEIVLLQTCVKTYYALALIVKPFTRSINLYFLSGVIGEMNIYEGEMNIYLS